MIEWILLLPTLILAAFGMMVIWIWDHTLFIMTYVISRPWLAVIAVGVGALILILETADRRRREESVK